MKRFLSLYEATSAMYIERERKRERERERERDVNHIHKYVHI